MTPSQSANGKQIQLTLGKLHPAQLQVIREAKRYNVLRCGRRWGKSYLLRDRLIHPMLKGFPTGWFSPTNKYLSDSWREIRSTLHPVTVDKSEQEHRIEIVGGGSIEMWSLESNDAGRSRKYAGIVIDEAAMVPDLHQQWDANIQATLVDYRGWAWVASTPKGNNFFKTLCDRGVDPMKPDWVSWHMPTTANPFISKEEITEKKANTTEGFFNQEYLAEFINWEGTVFRNVRDCATAIAQLGPEPGHEYVIGVDWGKSRDYTVFVVIDKTLRSMAMLDRSNQVGYDIQRGRLMKLRDVWRPTAIVAEVNSIGAPIIEQLQSDGVRVEAFSTQNDSKDEIIQHLALAFERQDIAILNDQVLISELEAFSGRVLPSGMIRYAAPNDGHDDTVIATGLAWSKVVGRGKDLSFMAYSKNEMDKVANSRLIKPTTSTSGQPCPQCSSPATILVPGGSSGMKCNQCGHRFGGPANAPQPLAASRDTMWKLSRSGRGLHL